MVLPYVRNQIQNALQFLPVQKSGCSIGALIGIGKIAGAVLLAAITVPHPHYHEDQQSQKAKTNADAIKAVGKMKCGTKTGEKAGVWQLR